MVEKILNITITRQQPKQISSNEIGVLTSIDIDEVLPGGAIRPYQMCIRDRKLTSLIFLNNKKGELIGSPFFN